ncbi:MAG: GTPase Era [Cytophagales bacterium]|nr:GTPase Era [Cytophagales bacterium]
MNDSKNFRSGFVTIMGRPNVGKSTLMNALTGTKLAITSPKAQTTRHRIFGIITKDNYQIVYSDTPGTITPKYKLQEQMMAYVNASLEDADLILLLVALEDKNDSPEMIEMALRTGLPIIFLVNKVDLRKGSQVEDKVSYWKELYPELEIFPVSAKENFNTEELFKRIIDFLPVHPPYFPEDSITDKPEKFFASETIREKIFLNYQKEIPYSSEVVVTEFKEEEKIIRIRAEIFIERDSQKGILIGHKGASLKKVGIEARKDMETFFGKQVHLETFVKVEKDWRRNEKKLKRFGY